MLLSRGWFGSNAKSASASKEGALGSWLSRGMSFFVAALLLHDPGGVGGVPWGGATVRSGDPDSAGSVPWISVGGSGGVGGIPFNDLGGSNGVGGIPQSARGARPLFATGDPDGVGGIPQALPGSVGGIPFTAHFATTAGLILDSTNAPIAGTPVLVFASNGTPIGAATTDELGAFVLTLPKVAGLTLVLPSLGIADVPVVAGHPLLVIVP